MLLFLWIHPLVFFLLLYFVFFPPLQKTLDTMEPATFSQSKSSQKVSKVTIARQSNQPERGCAIWQYRGIQASRLFLWQTVREHGIYDCIAGRLVSEGHGLSAVINQLGSTVLQV